MESSEPIKSRADALAAATLVVTGAVIAWPILAGGYLTYLDNPAHLAEVYAIAFEAKNGWSEIAFCGFPIGILHSPLWYGVLGLLVRIGLAAPPLYAACLLLGFVAPSLAVYAVGRRALSPAPATLLAWLLLVQSPAVVGVGSALGGMWTFYVASAGFVLLVDRLTLPCRAYRDLAWIAGLVGFILLTHLYTVVPLALLAVAHVWVSAGRRRPDPLGVPFQASAASLGVAAAAIYWAPLLAARGSLAIVPQNLNPAMVLARLAVPTHVFDLLKNEAPRLAPAVALASLPMLVLTALGVAGVFFWRRRVSDAPLYGAVVAATLLVLLLFVAGEFDVKWLGPGSWRLLYFVRIGLAFSAIPLVVRIARGVSLDHHGFARASVAAAAVAAVALGWWIGAPLRAAVPPPNGPGMTEVRGLWDWLRENKGDDWGRVYLQDTFGQPDAGVPLSQSHILALTAHRSGVRQLGATYGVAPYRTALWTPSEFGTLFRRFVGDDDDLSTTGALMARSNVTHLITSDVSTRQKLESEYGIDAIHSTGRFTVFKTQIECEWVRGEGADVAVDLEELATGRYRFSVRSGKRPGQLTVKSTAFPGWRLNAPGASRLRTDYYGLIALEGLPEGEFDVEIEFRPDRRPAWLSVFCWLVIIAAFAAARRTSPNNP
jgi:hypothetical protein